MHKEYGEAVRLSSQKTEQLRDLLARFGFQPSDLKTLHFGVETEYQTVKVRDEYKRRMVGYRYQHNLKVEFPSDNQRLGKILYALAHSPVQPEITFSYTVSNPEAIKNELLGRAIADAKAKAAVLTQAAGVALKEIQSIDYSWGEVNFEVHPMGLQPLAMAKMSMDCGNSSYDMDIEPDDVETADTVTVLWEIA